MAKHRLLVVDDASFVRDMVKKTIRNFFPDFVVEEAINGRKAQTMLTKSNYTLILCDWEMPEMSGIELLQWIRSSEEETLKTTPFIMVTSRGDKEHVVNAVQSGVNEYLGKPFSQEQLIQKIAKVLKLNIKTKASNPFAASGSSSLSSNKPASEASGSASVLMGSSSSAQALTGSTSKSKKETPKLKKRTMAQLRFGSGLNTESVLKDINLTEVYGIIRNQDQLPNILEQAVVDLEVEGSGDIARINGYVTMLQATENKSDTAFINIRVRFVDDDPEKMDFLSRYVASVRG